MQKRIGNKSLFKELRLKFRASKRLGAFSRACKQGMSIEEARAYSDQLYPPTAEDIAYEDGLRQNETGGSVFPWFSTLSLLYPISATIYIATGTPAPPVTIAGYGLANLGYLLFAAGIFTGTFGVFGMKKRWHVFMLAVACFTIGTLLSNMNT